MNTKSEKAILYVGALHYRVTESMLFKRFRPAGPIRFIQICRDNKTVSSLIHAYVSFKYRADGNTILIVKKNNNANAYTFSASDINLRIDYIYKWLYLHRQLAFLLTFIHFPFLSWASNGKAQLWVPDGTAHEDNVGSETSDPGIYLRRKPVLQ